MSIHLGIDLGGTKIEIIALDDARGELFRRRVPTPRGDYRGTLKGVPDVEVAFLSASEIVNQLATGAAHLGILLGEYRGAYLLTFAAYNAGGGRVKQWMDAYGDPRKPNVDPVDWVERIPITETRNYVQRVMENFVVYRAKFGENDTRAPQMELARAGL